MYINIIIDPWGHSTSTPDSVELILGWVACTLRSAWGCPVENGLGVDFRLKMSFRVFRRCHSGSLEDLPKHDQWTTKERRLFFAMQYYVCLSMMDIVHQREREGEGKRCSWATVYRYVYPMHRIHTNLPNDTRALHGWLSVIRIIPDQFLGSNIRKRIPVLLFSESQGPAATGLLIIILQRSNVARSI